MKKILSAPSEEQLAEMLQRCLDLILLEGMTVDQAIEMVAPWQHLIRPQVEAALLLHAMQAEFDPRPGFVVASKKRILQRIAQEPPQQLWLPRIDWQRVFAQFAVFLAVVMLLFTGLGMGIRQVQAATPEQALYGTKLFVEEIQVAFAFGNATQVVHRRLEYAQHRLDEVDYLIAAKLDMYIAPTMTNYQSQVVQAAHVIQMLPPEQLDLQQQLDRKLAAQLTQNEQRLVAVVQNVPESAVIIVQQSLQVVQQTLQTINATAPMTPQAGATATNPSPTAVPSSTISAASTLSLATPTNHSTSTQAVITASPTPTWSPIVTLTATVTLQPTPTGTVTSATVVPTPSSEIKPSKTPKPKPTQKLPPRSTKEPPEPPSQKPTKEK